MKEGERAICMVISVGIGYFICGHFIQEPLARTPIQSSPIRFPFSPQRQKLKHTPDASAQNTTSLATQSKADINADYKCLLSTWPDHEDSNENVLQDTRLKFPLDAEEHYREIHRVVEEWTNSSKAHCASHYCGPWIENHWMMSGKVGGNGAWKSLSDLPYGHKYVPLFIPWVDLFVATWFRFPVGFVAALLAVLRTDVPYVTVSQNDNGMWTKCTQEYIKTYPNILVFSGGGVGQVPIPLLKAAVSVQNNEIEMENRPYDMSFVGSQTHKVRRTMIELLNASTANISHTSYSGGQWKEIMKKSRLQLVPRGFGRTSYKLMEIFHMGFIPIYIYTDIPFVPYLDMIKELGYIVHIDDFPKFLTQISSVNVEVFEEREKKIISLRSSHFEWPGIEKQILKFLDNDETGDLRCQTQVANEMLGDDELKKTLASGICRI
eukprot:m.205279 g.205279  ORF g.205279 m.205279 type:complete len:436 (-) comp32909_c4_seq2:125-1432(-)